MGSRFRSDALIEVEVVPLNNFVFKQFCAAAAAATTAAVRVRVCVHFASVCVCVRMLVSYVVFDKQRCND